MAKRSVQGSRPLALAEALRSGQRFFPDTAIEAMIAIAGQPPLGPFAISFPTTTGKYRSRKVSGREALRQYLETDARALAVAREAQRGPTARQAEKKFAAIAASADRLLKHLEVGPRHNVDDMPTSLRSGGLLPFLVKEAETLNRSANSLLQDDVRSVVRLARSAEAARRRFEQIAKSRSMPKRNEGDRPLDRFVGSVVGTCWLLVYRRDIAVGPKPIAFVQAALRGVGEKPSADAVRDRIRRIFQRRGKSKTK
jgi:hypothetical protein